jgi:hypothetical protein
MAKNGTIKAFEKNRNALLPICLLMDVIGIFTYAIPGIGEAADIVWAPISGLVYYFVFKGKIGIFGGSFFLSENVIFES